MVEAKQMSTDLSPKELESLAAKAALKVEGVLATRGSAFQEAEAEMVQKALEKQREVSGTQYDEVKLDKKISEEEMTSGVDVQGTPIRGLTMTIGIVVAYGENIPKIYEEIISNVQKALREKTGYADADITVRVENIMKEEDFHHLHYKQI